MQIRKQQLELDVEQQTGFQIGKGICRDCILSPSLFNLCAEYIMRNAGLEEAQAGIKIAGRNINNLRYADDITLMAESEEELKSLLMKVKVKSLSHVRLFVIPWTIVYQAPPSTGFSRQEYWSGLPFPSPGYLPDPGIEPWFPTLQADSSPSEPPGNP